MDIKIKFWQKVARLRKEMWLSQEWFAEKCWLHRTYISIIERGKKNVCLENIEIIAKNLNVDIKELFEF